jgi:hypothetical protein
LSVTGLDHLLCDVVKYCFAGEPTRPPAKARDILSDLIHPDHSLCNIMVKGKLLLYLKAWPSWLNRGYKRHITTFHKVFYANEAVQLPCSDCNICKRPITTTIWHHVFYECTKLQLIDNSAIWTAFCNLIEANFQGLAIYTCFPLFTKNFDKIQEMVKGNNNTVK